MSDPLPGNSGLNNQFTKGIFKKLANAIMSEKKKKLEIQKRFNDTLASKKIISLLTKKEKETQITQSFKTYLHSLYNYKISLKKYQYQLWDQDKIEGKIQNHLLVFGYNEGCIHFIKAIRKKCELPIVFFDNQDIQLQIFKANNLYGNIFHFWGDAFDRSHLEKACI